MPNKKFKVGDKVTTATPPRWSKKPMTVDCVLNGGDEIRCKHPDHGNGVFYARELTIVKKPKATPAFKQGDKVHAFRNATWGLKPMVVDHVASSVVRCAHPDLGWAFFAPDDLQAATPEFQAKADAVSLALDEYERKAAAVFGAQSNPLKINAVYNGR